MGKKGEIYWGGAVLQIVNNNCHVFCNLKLSFCSKILFFGAKNQKNGKKSIIL
jgi:hypothetical protein